MYEIISVWYREFAILPILWGNVSETVPIWHLARKERRAARQWTSMEQTTADHEQSILIQGWLLHTGRGNEGPVVV